MIKIKNPHATTKTNTKIKTKRTPPKRNSSTKKIPWVPSALSPIISWKNDIKATHIPKISAILKTSKTSLWKNTNKSTTRKN